MERNAGFNARFMKSPLVKTKERRCVGFTFDTSFINATHFVFVF